MTAHLFVDLISETESAVIHSEEETLNFETRIHAGLDNLYRVEQLADAFQGEVFALYGDDDRVGGGERVHCDEAQAGTAIDEDEIVIFDDGTYHLLQRVLVILEVQQFDFGSDQVDVGRHDVESFNVCRVDDVLDVNLPEQCVVERVLELADVHTHAARCVGLRVSVDEEHFLFECGERGSEVHACGCFAHTALLVNYCDCFAHVCRFY